MEFGALKTTNLAAATTSTGVSGWAGVRGYTVAVVDLDISSTAVVAFECVSEGGVAKNILATFADGTTASSSVASSELARLNVTGVHAIRINVISLSVGNVTANVTAIAGGTAIST